MVLLFTDIEIIEHPIIFDSSYDCMTGRFGMFCDDDGPLLQLSWEAKSRTVIDVDVYEIMRDERREVDQLRLRKNDRIQMLEECGVDMEEVERARRGPPTITTTKQTCTSHLKYELCKHVLEEISWKRFSTEASTNQGEQPFLERRTSAASCA